MFERFTDQARRVVVLAQEEARLLTHNYIGTEHVLLGLIHEDEGVAAKALESLGISLEAARQQVRDIIGEGQMSPTGHIPFTPRATKVLELSFREAPQLDHNDIGTEHILLGLISEGEGSVAAQALHNLGVDLPRVRRAVIRELDARGEHIELEAIDIEIRLRPMRENEWDEWRSRAVELYADDLVRNHAVEAEDAKEKTIAQFEGLLPNGLRTTGHHLFVAERAASEQRVGYLWYGPRSNPHDPSIAWLYDLFVEKPLRGRGLGRELLRLLEDEVRAAGISRLELNVFGDNEPARHLYEKTGYTEMARQMGKNLPS